MAPPSAAAAHPGVMTLRPYQQGALDAIDQARADGVRRSLVVLPTGCGKTVVFSSLIKRRWPSRTLLLAHREELLLQAADKLTKVAPEVREHIGFVRGRQDEVHAQIVVASVQTLGRSRRLARMPREFGTVIIDEAHHAVAPSYQRILDYIQADQVVGFTATPQRGNGDPITDVWDQIVYARSLIDMISRGYLSDLVGVRVHVEGLDLGSVGISHGDYKPDELAQALRRAHMPTVTAVAIRQHAADRKTIVFTQNVDLAAQTASEIRRQGFTCEHVWGDMHRDDRHRVLAAFTAGEIRVLVNVDVLCLDMETEVLTDEGWVGPEAITAEHRVANWATDGTVFFAKPLELVRRPRRPGEGMVELGMKGSNRNLRVTETHRMLYSRGNGDWKKTAARDLVGKAGIALPAHGLAEPAPLKADQVPSPGDAKRSRAVSSNAYTLRKREGFDWDASFVEAARRYDARHALRRKDPAELTEDECRLIGFWIGDGTRTELANGGIEYVITQSEAYPAIIRWFDELLARLDIDVARRPGAGAIRHIRWSFCRGTGFGSQRRRGLFALEPYLDKDGSDLLWGLGENQFAALLEGFWFADGQHGTGEQIPNSMLITNSNERLLSHLQAIAAVRGYTTYLRDFGEPVAEHHKQLKALYFRKGGVHQIGGERYGMRRDDTPLDEEVWCVKTTTRNIITRRRGAVVVMGNTEGYDEPSVTCVVLAAPTRSQIAYSQKVGRGTRLYPGKRDCLILDLVSASEDLSLQSLPKLFDLSEPPERGERVTHAVRREAAADQPGLEDVLAGLTVTSDTEMAAEQANLFDRDELAWMPLNGRWAIGVGNDRVLVLNPTAGGDWQVLNIGRDGFRIEASGLDFGYAQGAAEETVRAHAALTSADAPWRSEPVSEKQLGRLRWRRTELAALGVQRDPVDRGEASDLMSLLDAMERLPRVRAALERMVETGDLDAAHASAA